MKYINLYLLFFSILFSSKIQEDDIELFLLSRYGGDSANVSLFISDDFIYKHSPYVGLGVETRYVDESLLITKVLNDSIQKYLQVGDRVYEHNNEIVDSLGLVTNGPIGEKQKLIVIKNGERDFRVMEIPLEEYHFEENKNSFLEFCEAKWAKISKCKDPANKTKLRDTFKTIRNEITRLTFLNKKIPYLKDPTTNC